MKTFGKVSLASTLMISLLFFAGCGKNSNDSRYFQTGFRIIESYPYAFSQNASQADPVIVTFSEPVNQASLIPNTTFTVEKIPFNQSDVNRTPVNVIVSFGNSGQTATIMAAGTQWENNYTYQVNFTSQITSVSGNMLEPYILTFVVGNIYATSVAGPPTIMNIWPIMQSGYPNECISFIVWFNEDLSIMPNVMAISSQLAGLLWPDGAYPLWVEPVYSGYMNQFWYLFPWDGYGYGCHPGLFNIGTQLKIQSSAGRDTDGNVMAMHEKSFYAGVNYWCMHQNCQP